MDHHYCPRFYTKQWTNREGRLIHYTVAYGKIISRHVAPTETGFTSDLYAKKNTPDDDKYTIETKCYKNIDNDAAKILQKITKEGLDQLTIKEKNNWCRFIISMLTRHPSLIDNAKNIETNIIDRQIMGLPILQFSDQSLLRKSIDYWRNNAVVEAIAHMATFQSEYIEFCEKSTDLLLKLAWWVEDFRVTPFTLLTSDYPVILSPLKKHTEKFSTLLEILSNANYLLSLPLTPKLCFYAAMKKNIVTTNHNQLIKIQNNLTVRKAKNYVYANDCSQEYFIKKRLQLRIKT